MIDPHWSCEITKIAKKDDSNDDDDGREGDLEYADLGSLLVNVWGSKRAVRGGRRRTGGEAGRNTTLGLGGVTGQRYIYPAHTTQSSHHHHTS